MRSPPKPKRSIYAAVSTDEGGYSGHTARGSHFSTEGRLRTAIALNLAYTLAELWAYYAFDSLAMLADGFHNLSDVASIVIAWYIERLKRSSRRGQYTFGPARAEVLGGVLNGAILVSLSVYIVCDALPRLFHPPVIGATLPFIAVAAAGVPVNLVSACMFIGSAVQPVHAHSHGDGHECTASHAAMAGNMNLWAIFLHNLGDAMTSIGVTAVALALYWHDRGEVVTGSCMDGFVLVARNETAATAPPGGATEWAAGMAYQELRCSWVDFLDPGVSIVLAAVICLTVRPLLRKGVPILLDQAPSSVDVSALRRQILAVPGVRRVDTLHVWVADGSMRPLGVLRCAVDQRLQPAAATADLRMLLEVAGAAGGGSVVEVDAGYFCSLCGHQSEPESTACGKCHSPRPRQRLGRLPPPPEPPRAPGGSVAAPSMLVCAPCAP
jgi:zinc transporter 1